MKHLLVQVTLCSMILIQIGRDDIAILKLVYSSLKGLGTPAPCKLSRSEGLIVGNMKYKRELQDFLFLLLPTNCLNVFDHFVGLALKGLSYVIEFL